MSFRDGRDRGRGRRCAHAALGILDRTGSHLERLITTGIDEETRAEIGDLPMDHGVLRVLLRAARQCGLPT
jgi:hypothetical protein